MTWDDYLRWVHKAWLERCQAWPPDSPNNVLRSDYWWTCVDGEWFLTDEGRGHVAANVGGSVLSLMVHLQSDGQGWFAPSPGWYELVLDCFVDWMESDPDALYVLARLGVDADNERRARAQGR